MKRISVAVASSSFSQSQQLRAALTRLAVQVTANERGLKFSEEELIAFLNRSEAEVAIIGLEPFSKRVMDQCPSVQLVCKYGVGIDNLDLKAMQDSGVALGWTAGVNRRSVSELVLAFAFGHFRNVFASVHKMRDGKWVKEGGRQVSNLTVGIVGFGNIGSDLAALLKPLGCKILIHDLLDKTREASLLGAQQVSYEELLHTSQLITFHVPSTELTRHMYGQAQLKQSSKEVLICNTSRGDIVDFHAVCTAARNGDIGGFAADVFPHEPFDGSHFSACPNIYLSPHIGGNSKESVLAMGMAAIEHLASYIRKKAGAERFVHE